MIHAFRNQFLERNHNLKYNATLCNLVRGECCLTWITSDALLADSVGGKKDDLGRKFWFCLFVVWFCFGFFVRVCFFFLKKAKKAARHKSKQRGRNGQVGQKYCFYFLNSGNKKRFQCLPR